MIDTPETPQEPPLAWREAVDRAEADLAAGRVHDGAEMHDRLRASIARMEQPAKPRTASQR